MIYYFTEGIANSVRYSFEVMPSNPADFLLLKDFILANTSASLIGFREKLGYSFDGVVMLV